MIEKIDVICPVYFITMQYFKNNIASWIKELPINKIYFGLNFDSNNMLVFNNEIEPFLKEQNVEYEIISQGQYKTLGYCLADLMKRVQTKWFAFVHSDVELSEYCFKLIKPYMKSDVGIIESARMIYNGVEWKKDHPTHFAERSYSGFQLFQTKVHKDFIETIEDDYIYRNEDFIFRNVCEREGFKYQKSWAMHYHQVLNNQWSTGRKLTYEQQWKGLIKYATPDPICLDACVQAFRISITEFDAKLNELLNFAEKTNPIWKQKLFEFYTMELITKLYYNKIGDK